MTDIPMSYGSCLKHNKLNNPLYPATKIYLFATLFVCMISVTE